jgi:hypothetical protein
MAAADGAAAAAVVPRDEVDGEHGEVDEGLGGLGPEPPAGDAGPAGGDPALRPAAGAGAGLAGLAVGDFQALLRSALNDLGLHAPPHPLQDLQGGTETPDPFRQVGAGPFGAPPTPHREPPAGQGRWALPAPPGPPPPGVHTLATYRTPAGGGQESLLSLAARTQVAPQVAAAFEASLGGSPGSILITDLLNIRKIDLDECINELQVLGARATPLARSSVVKLIIAAAECTGTPLPDFHTVGPLDRGVGTGTGTGPKRKMSAIIDQADDGDLDELPADKVRNLFIQYTHENGGEPAEGERCTADQLAALSTRLARDMVPYTDFGVWGPFGRRMQKAMRFTAQVFVAGELTTKAFRGPDSFPLWRAGWRVFRTALLMLHGAKPGQLDAYEERVRGLAEIFPDNWGILMAADDLMRSERWEEIRRRFDSARAWNGQQGPHDAGALDPAAPWGTVIKASAEDRDWWYEHVNQPALLAARRAGGQAAGQAAGFLALGPPGNWAPPRPLPPGKGKGSKGKGVKDKRGKGAAGNKVLQVKHTHNAAGTQICFAWGRAAQGCSTPCPNSRAHQCEFCLGPHRTIDPNCLSKPDGWTPPAPRK